MIDLQSEMELRNHDISKTSLQPFLDAFQKQINKLVKEELSSVKRDREEDEDQTVDF